MSSGATHPGLYLHLPFCARICPYCDFYVLTGDRTRQQEFIHRLSHEIRLCGSDPWPEFVESPPEAPFDTLYLGGGTPSLLAADLLQHLLRQVADYLPTVERPWIGLEANPEDVDRRGLEAWRILGVSFLSLGVQSFDDGKLRFLQRTHDARTALDSVALARGSGIDTLSVDLIYGLPGETEAQWRRDLDRALELQPDHLSCYQLTVEPRTPFGFRRQRGQLEEAPEAVQADLFMLTHRYLEHRGFAAYEVSNFAVSPTHRSRHNRKYWDRTPYLGLGPSAHSFAAHQRWWNRRKIKPYAEALDRQQRPIEEHEDLGLGDRILEWLMLGLRTPEGTDLDTFPADAGSRIWSANRRLIEELETAGLIQIDGRRLQPTLAGLAVAEAIAGRFVISAGDLPSRPVIC